MINLMEMDVIYLKVGKDTAVSLLKVSNMEKELIFM